MKFRQFGWYTLQVGIVAAVFAFYVLAVFPDMEEPLGLHVPIIIGVGLAFAVTVAILIVKDLWERLTRRNAHRNRGVRKSGG